PAELRIDVHQKVSNRRGGQQIARRREFLRLKRQERFGPITLVENQVVRVFPRRVGDVQRSAFVNVEIDGFADVTGLGKDSSRVAEVDCVATLLDRFTKLGVLSKIWTPIIVDEIAKRREVRRHNRRIANESQVSDVVFDLTVAIYPALL